MRNIARRGTARSNEVDAKAPAAGLFDGRGSCGDGAAMRVAPPGAACAHDPGAVAGPAAAPGSCAHTHPQVVDGATAVANGRGRTRCRAWGGRTRGGRPCGPAR
ncbi:ADP-ribosylglycohydrolase family protein [Kitasatospora sp. NPDC008115]|uniref:ADP-ribosylglycohydrolase family protein n=1 Tax=Kitasatospora sp. NPDC008115 TaxID=3364022 RepID=UPI0036ED2509